MQLTIDQIDPFMAPRMVLSAKGIVILPKAPADMALNQGMQGRGNIIDTACSCPAVNSIRPDVTHYTVTPIQ